MSEYFADYVSSSTELKTVAIHVLQTVVHDIAFTSPHLFPTCKRFVVISSLTSESRAGKQVYRHPVGFASQHVQLDRIDLCSLWFSSVINVRYHYVIKTVH